MQLTTCRQSEAANGSPGSGGASAGACQPAMPLHQELSNIIGKPHKLCMHPPDRCLVGQREHIVTRNDVSPKPAALLPLRPVCGTQRVFELVSYLFEASVSVYAQPRAASGH